jgi:DnaJ-class molecular chaperone
MVEVPTRLSRPLREKLEEFAALANDEAYPQRKSFLEKAKRFFSGK